MCSSSKAGIITRQRNLKPSRVRAFSLCPTCYCFCFFFAFVATQFVLFLFQSSGRVSTAHCRVLGLTVTVCSGTLSLALCIGYPQALCPWLSVMWERPQSRVIKKWASGISVVERIVSFHGLVCWGKAVYALKKLHFLGVFWIISYVYWRRFCRVAEPISHVQGGVLTLRVCQMADFSVFLVHRVTSWLLFSFVYFF